MKLNINPAILITISLLSVNVAADGPDATPAGNSDNIIVTGGLGTQLEQLPPGFGFNGGNKAGTWNFNPDSTISEEPNYLNGMMNFQFSRPNTNLGNNPDSIILRGLNYGNYNGPLRQTRYWYMDQNWQTEINIGIAEDAITYNPNDIFGCAVDPDTQLLAMLQNFENQNKVQSCIGNRRSKKTHPNLSDGVLMASDIRTCDCLRGQGEVEDMEFASQIMNQSLAANPLLVEPETRNRVEQKVNEIYNDQLSSTLNNILGYAGIVLNNPQQAVDFSNNVFLNSQAVAEGQSSLNLDYKPDPVSMFEDKFPMAQGQCVTFTEYLRQKMIPEGRDLEIIGRELGRGPENWNFKILEARYRSLMELDPSVRLRDHLSEIETLKAKLVFLERNPLIKYYMGSDGPSIGSKTELIQHMRDLNHPDCQEITSQCSENFHAKLQGFFSQDNAMTIVRAAARDDISNKARERASEDILSTAGDLTLSRNRPSQAHVVERFFGNIKITTPENCTLTQNMTMDQRTATECLQVFSAYCKTIDRYEDHVRNLNVPDPRVADDLDEKRQFNFNPNLAENEDFERFNNVECGQRVSDRGFAIRRDRVDFAEYMSDVCRNQGRERNCQIRSIEELATLRQEFYRLYPKAVGDSTPKPRVSLSNGSIPRSAGTPRYFTPERPTFDSVNEVETTMSNDRSTGNIYSNAGSTQTTPINNLRNDEEQDSVFNYSNYTNLSAGSSDADAGQVATTGPQRIQDMDQERREELMEDWEQEYNTWKERYGSDKSPATVARDSELRTEISTLRALLDQQRTISDQQYQLLNDAIAARTRMEQENLQRDQERERSVAAAERRSGGTGVVSRNSVEEEIARGPASVAEPQFNAAGVTGGGASSSSSSGASIGGSSSGNSAALGSSGTSDSVAREEAKLVNLRRFSDGSIIIESTGAGSGGTVNAITVPVSDEQYRILQTNPQGLNLSQIERSIPEDQISQLERNGEIILLLRNGENPPFEVKVEKRDNRLVYSVRDQTSGGQVPVRRVHLRSSLENLTRQLTNPTN